MKTQLLDIKTAIQVAKTPSEVFEAIVDPAKMTNYFISESNGRMEKGKELIWRFPEFDMDVPVRIGKIDIDKYISFYWFQDDIELLIEMTLTPVGTTSTIVTVTEKSRENDESGLNWLKGNTEGWANILACLKAWLEYGINLRKGGYDFMKNITS
jgi:uncharacterized protein YndB with AHSA1/START domain